MKILTDEQLRKLLRDAWEDGFFSADGAVELTPSDSLSRDDKVEELVKKA